MAITLKEYFALKNKVIVEVKPEISSIKKLERKIKKQKMKNNSKKRLSN